VQACFSHTDYLRVNVRLPYWFQFKYSGDFSKYGFRGGKHHLECRASYHHDSYH
jgi:hypothetical protein